MKKILFTAVTAVLLSLPVYSQSKDFTFELESQIGIRNAVLNEFVYGINSKTKEQYHLSLLNWNLKSTFYSGLTADAAFKRFHLTGNFKAFIPNNYGSMDDSDWLQDSGYRTGNSSLKTNYSEHEQDFLMGLNASIDAKFDFHPAKGFTLSPSIGFSYETYSLTANNGTLYYGKKNDSLPLYNSNDPNYYAYNDVLHRDVKPIYGEVVKLERYDYYTWIGVDLNYVTDNGQWGVGLSADISPWAYIFSRDSHNVRQIYFIDIGSGFFSAFKAEIYVQYNLNNLVAFKLTGSGLFTAELKGNDYTSGSYDGPFKNNGPWSGSATRYIDLQTSVILRF